MGQLSFLILSSFAIITAASFGLQRKRRRRRAARVHRLDWARVARGLFHSPAEQGIAPEEHLGIILGEVLEELDLTYAMVGLHESGRTKILHISVRGYAPPLPLRAGMEISDEDTYAGNLAGRGESIVIDFASLSGWRTHPASQKLGWETFMGTKRSLANGSFLSVACFATRPRDYLFTVAEKRFLQDASAWVEGVLAREGRISAENFDYSPATESVTSEYSSRN